MTTTAATLPTTPPTAQVGGPSGTGNPRAQLTHFERRLLDLLERHSGKPQGICYSTSRLAEWLNATVDYTRKALARLVRLGLVRRVVDYALKSRRRLFVTGPQARQSQEPSPVSDRTRVPSVTGTLPMWDLESSEESETLRAGAREQEPERITAGSDATPPTTIESNPPEAEPTPPAAEPVSPEQIAEWRRQAAGPPGVDRGLVALAKLALRVVENPEPTPPPPPRPVAAATPAQVETEDLIRRLANPGTPAQAVEDAAARVAERLNDRKSLGGFRKVFREVYSGLIPVLLARAAWRAARSPTAAKPGAVFMATISEWREKNRSPGSTRQSTPGDRPKGEPRRVRVYMTRGHETSENGDRSIGTVLNARSVHPSRVELETFGSVDRCSFQPPPGFSGKS